MPIYSQPYKFWEFDLGVARTDVPLGLAGTDIIVFKNTHVVELRLDDIRNDKIPISAADQSSPVYISGVPFKELWLTNQIHVGGRLQLVVLFSGTTTQLIQEIQKQPGGISGFLRKLGL